MHNLCLHEQAGAANAPTLHRTLSVNPENAQAHDLLGLCSVRSADTQDAERNFVEAIRLEPLLPEPHSNLAYELSILLKRVEAVTAT